ncbi:isochorismatase hydrolase [Rhizobium grahamii CCGE 502]|uniref:Isochorismatase hydrolase n=1 Tax=Rhizobium grahamii CCGE 502 TaxID=990285 RepID=S3HE50_9HYPH|nr:isochorismatase hydrolase [Rhizobium grahamii]EPE96335.1 isochorismatase hydrolase [Rhizobium grahamii CCGE 502]
MEDQIQGPLLPELKEILPEAFDARIKRPGIVNAMHHDGFNLAVKAIGRKKLFVAGVTTEICVTFPVLGCERSLHSLDGREEQLF